MTVQEAIKIIQKAHELGLLFEDDLAKIRAILAPKYKCIYCRDRGGWEDPEEGQFVSCRCAANSR